MLGGLLILIISAVIAIPWIESIRKRHPAVDANLLRKMFWYHLLLTFAYFGYTLFNPSDSRAYYEKVMTNYRGDTWMSFYGTSTTFIEFVSYPFIRYFSFSYEAMMALFSFFGYLGFIYMYVFFRENIKFKHTFAGFDLLKIVFFLPNLHFWSASLGKGSIIFLGIGLFFYGLSKLSSRAIALAIGALIIYHVRPHVMLVILVSSAMGFIFSSKGVSVAVRIVFLLAAGAAFFYIYNDVLTLVGIDEDQFLSQGLDMSARARELSKATSGIDLSQYSLPMQVFTFLYRPLFFDAPGLLGIIVSFENVFYLVVTLSLITNLKGIKYLFTGNFLAKSALLSFLTVSIALAQVSGNLGLAMRQKSQVMILLLFVVLAFRDHEKLNAWKTLQLKRRMRQASLQPTVSAVK